MAKTKISSRICLDYREPLVAGKRYHGYGELHLRAEVLNVTRYYMGSLCRGFRVRTL